MLVPFITYINMPELHSLLQAMASICREIDAQIVYHIVLTAHMSKHQRYGFVGVATTNDSLLSVETRTTKRVSVLYVYRYNWQLTGGSYKAMLKA